MNHLILTSCKICDATKTSTGFGQHIKKSHNISLTEYIIQYEYDGIHPLCKCGCGKQVTIRGYKVMDYINNHDPNTHFKKGVNPRKNVEKWHTNLVKAIRTYNIEAKKLDPNYRSGSNNNVYGYKHSDDVKLVIKKNVAAQIANGKHPFLGTNNGRIKRSSLELKFEQYLQSVGMSYDTSVKLKYIIDESYPRYKYYDFYVPAINTLIEIHGSYWHPRHTDNLTPLQQKNLINDAFKIELAKQYGFNILSIYDVELDEFIQDNTLYKLMQATRKDVPELKVVQ